MWKVKLKEDRTEWLLEPSDLDEETVQGVRRRFDEIVDMDVPLNIYYTDRDELDVGDAARKQSFLEKIPRGVDKLRMVEIGEHALTFSIPKNLIGKPLSVIQNPGTGLVVLSFDGQRRLYRHEKGGYCKEIRGGCNARDCPKIMK